MEQVNAVSTAPIQVHPTMNWGAIFAGWVVAIGIAGLLFTGGLALGLSAVDANNSDVTTKAIGTGAAIWMILTWVGSMFVGGMFASWFDGKDDATMGTMHGVTVWGLSAAAGGLMLAHGAGNALTMGATMASTAATLWVAFLSSLLGLLAAAIGGWLGSSHIHRVYHLRSYARSPGRR
jgi:hypothetical protein